MPITNRDLTPGDRFVATYKKQPYEAVVDEIDPLTIRVLVGQDAAMKDTFKSLSAAGSAVMGGIACNGWRFWSPAGADGEAEERAMRASLPSGAGAAADAANVAEKAPARTNPPAKPRTFRLIKRTPNQKGVDEGCVRYFCAACMKSFVVEGGEPPTVCPEGHRTDDPELTSGTAATE